jgi:uncharacterized repeat protein (TIGR03803 family)
MKTKNQPMKTKTSMKTFIINLFLLPALIAGLGLIPAGRVTAQTFTTLHSFAGYPSDGSGPVAVLILSGNTLYGTAFSGGSSGDGTVFAVNTDGTGFTTLHIFTGSPSDGQLPRAVLILSGNTLYGTASGGVSGGNGTVFALNTDGTGFTTLHSFTFLNNFINSDGQLPAAGLILSGNTLYGTASGGGSGGNGTVFALNTDGTGFTTLHSFTALSATSPYANSDGAVPEAVLILSGNTLYGTARNGGTSGDGTVFAVHTDGTGFTTLHSFTAMSGPYTNINSDGAHPVAGLILSGTTLYGTAFGGGTSGDGTVFAVSTDGTGFTTLHSFTDGSDGRNPVAGLILSGNTLYGTAEFGGSSGNGTVFAVNTDGTGFTTVYSFTHGSDGAFPQAGLILSGNTLYGMAENGGSSGNNGTVFSLSLPPPPQLTIIPSGANVILTWPTNAAGFALQSTTNLVSPVVWSPVSPGPVVVNGQYAVTNSTSGTNKFYQLSQ